MTSVVETALVPDAAATSPPRSATQARSASASPLDPAADIRDLPRLLLVARPEPARLRVSSCSVPDPSASIGGLKACARKRALKLRPSVTRSSESVQGRPFPLREVSDLEFAIRG